MLCIKEGVSNNIIFLVSLNMVSAGILCATVGCFLHEAEALRGSITFHEISTSLSFLTTSKTLPAHRQHKSVNDHAKGV